MAHGLVNTVVVYKVDRLSRSILDFHNMMKYFEKYGANFVSITQSFDTSTSMGKLTLNMLLSFAQFEREVSSERVRAKIRASKAKGLWVGGTADLTGFFNSELAWEAGIDGVVGSHVVASICNISGRWCGLRGPSRSRTRFCPSARGSG